MLLILNRSSGYVPLKILSIEDGTILKDFKHLLHRNKKVDFIEQFNEKLLVKQENENLQILDVSNLLLFLCFYYIGGKVVSFFGTSQVKSGQVDQKQRVQN